MDLSETKDLFLEDSFGGNMKSKEESGHKLFSRMNGEQLSAWQLSIRPQNQALARAKRKWKITFHWKYQRFAKNYLRCIHAVDENVGRLYDLLNQTKPMELGTLFTQRAKVVFSERMVGLETDGCMNPL